MSASGHPLVTDRAQIITQQMVRVYQLCLDRVGARRTAVLFEGSSRTGKSCCATFVASHMRIQVPTVLVMLHVARYREPGQRQSILKELCASENTHPQARGLDYLQHLLAYIEAHVTGQPAPHCVLIVDEIQQWRPNDFQVLTVLYNYLQLQGITLTLIGFAQPEIYSRLSGLRAVEHYQIIARFFSEIIPFRGCQNIDELATILRACDTGSEFPSGSGISYTAYFIPQAYAAGFRLVPLAELFWNAFGESVAGKYIKNLPMQHVRESIVCLLLLISPQDSGLLEADDKLVNEAVRRSGIGVFCDVL
ncbi:ATP-binding protein [Pseudomonas hormoni]